MENILKLLEEKIKEDEFQFRLRNGIDPQEIYEFEEDFEITLPRSYKTFLIKYNGGFICNGHWAEYIWETGNEGLPEEHSLILYSLEKLTDEYRSFIELEWTARFQGYDLPSIPIPFGETAGGSILAFNESLDHLEESAVFDCSTTVFNDSRGILFSNFYAFLAEYIAEEGYVLSFVEQAETIRDKYERLSVISDEAKPYTKLLKISDMPEKNLQIKNLLSENPDNLFLKCLSASVLLNKKSYYEARDICTEVLATDPRNLWALSIRQVASYKSLYDLQAAEDGKKIRALEKKR